MKPNTEELERDVAEARARLARTIDAIQQRLSIGGLADELIGSLRATPFGSVLDTAAAVVKRNPVPVIMVAAGVGWLIHRMSKKNARTYTSYRRIEGEAAEIPVLNTGNARIYDPDISPRHPTQDSLESRREMNARM
jgi:Protein of unknown function (DUF3618)